MLESQRVDNFRANAGKARARELNIAELKAEEVKTKGSWIQ
jgi:hypothetical protein